MRSIMRLGSALVVLGAATCLAFGVSEVADGPTPAFADGPAACTSAPPTYPYAGYCGTYARPQHLVRHLRPRIPDGPGLRPVCAQRGHRR